MTDELGPALPFTVFYGPVARSYSNSARRQLSGDCYAHSAARCLVRLLQQAYYVKYNNNEVADTLYESIHDYIVEHLGTNGGSVHRAINLCLGYDAETNGMSGDLWNLRDHLEIKEWKGASTVSLEQVHEVKIQLLG